MPQLYPLLFEDDFRDKPWGSRRLHDLLKKNVSPDRPIGESWEIWSGSVIANGAWAGKSVDDVIAQHWDEVMGTRLAAASPRTFPLLYKFIDANEWLSVQVHPDDSYAQAHEGVPFGKTEAWYIVHADPGAQIIYGWNKELSREAVAAAIENDQIKQDLNFVEVKTGDIVRVPAGTVHALGSGLVIAEIQQNSDVTYRLYDWGRVGLDGKPRELHVNQSLDTLDYSAVQDGFLNSDDVEAVNGARRVAICRYFSMDIVDLEQPYQVDLNGERFLIVVVLRGGLKLAYPAGELDLKEGSSVLLPAALGKTVLSSADQARLLLVQVPDASELAAESDARKRF
jgi:mannose-6-phosphate isomerase